LHVEAAERHARVGCGRFNDERARLRLRRSADDEPRAAFGSQRQPVRRENFAGELQRFRRAGFGRHEQRGRQQTAAVDERSPRVAQLVDDGLHRTSEQRACGLRVGEAGRERSRGKQKA
jgi:hypothetical protein